MTQMTSCINFVNIFKVIDYVFCTFFVKGFRFMFTKIR